MTGPRAPSPAASAVPVPRVVVVGCPSIDRLEQRGRATEVVGGAGFLTALAARLGGAHVGLVARVPEALPPALGAAFGPAGIDPGGLVARAGALPSFVIRYDDADQASYLAVDAGMEAELVADDVPVEWLGADVVHVASLAGRASQQLAFVRRLRDRGFAGLVSAGTYVRAAREETETVRALFGACDLAFCNREEVGLIYPDGVPAGAPARLCVTLGAEGARVHEGGRVALRAPDPGATMVEPTGAGDAFCGGFLGALVTGADPLEAGLAAARVAISDLGGRALAAAVLALAPRPRARPVAPSRDVARVDPARVAHLAVRLAAVATASELDFTGPQFPVVGAPHVLALFAQATAHQFGFWEADARGFVAPMVAPIEGVRRKGSDFVWAAFTRAAREDASLLDPARMAADPLLFDRIARADDGRCPVPAVGLHRALHLALGAHLVDRGPFEAIVARANAAEAPVRALLDALASVPGYAEDPLAKKATLLAIVLGNRPERLLALRDRASIGPIVDYHLMRGCLRTGAVVVDDPEVRATLEARAWIAPADEAAIRAACHAALASLVATSGLSVAAVDGFFFVNGRSRCVEVGAVDCAGCPIEAACARSAALFQPVVRTDAY